MSDLHVSKDAAAKLQSQADKSGENTGKNSTPAVAQGLVDKAEQVSKEATAKGFSTNSNYDEPSTKPDTDTFKPDPVMH